MCARKLRTTARDPDAPSTTAKTTPTQPAFPRLTLFHRSRSARPAVLHSSK